MFNKKEPESTVLYIEEMDSFNNGLIGFSHIINSVMEIHISPCHSDRFLL